MRTQRRVWKEEGEAPDCNDKPAVSYVGTEVYDRLNLAKKTS